MILKKNAYAMGNATGEGVIPVSQARCLFPRVKQIDHVD